MTVRSLSAALALLAAALAGPALVAAPAHASATSLSVAAKHACTKTASGKCIKGGEFCPKAKKGKAGYDAKGRKYTCKGAGSHPHWEKP